MHTTGRTHSAYHQHHGFASQQALRVLLLGLLLIVSQRSLAQISFSGYGATGFKYYNRLEIIRYNSQVYYEGKFQANFTVNKQIEGQLDFRGNSEDHSIDFREFSAKLDYWKRFKVKMGNIRIPFGREQLIERDEYYTVDHSFIHRSINNFGYGGRAVSFMAYYNYSDKREDYPYAYYVSVFRNNSLVSGAAARFSYHAEDWVYSVGGLYQYQAGEETIGAEGLSADASYEAGSFSSSVELFYVQDPVEGIRRRLAGLSDKVFAGGVKSISATQFKVDGEVIKTIEPVLGLAYYAPDMAALKAHTLELVLAGNFYLDTDARLRLDLDFLLTRNQFVSDYSIHDSRFAIELQVRY